VIVKPAGAADKAAISVGSIPNLFVLRTNKTPVKFDWGFVGLAGFPDKLALTI